MVTAGLVALPSSPASAATPCSIVFASIGNFRQDSYIPPVVTVTTAANVAGCYYSNIYGDYYLFFYNGRDWESPHHNSRTCLNTRSCSFPSAVTYDNGFTSTGGYCFDTYWFLDTGPTEYYITGPERCIGHHPIEPARVKPSWWKEGPTTLG